MKELTWITKSYRQRLSKNDVGITLSKPDAIRPNCSFRIRNNKSDSITDTGYIKVALSNNRLFFSRANETEGFKLGHASKDGTSRVYPIKGLTDLKNGEYDLLFDAEYGLFYVDLSKNKIKD